MDTSEIYSPGSSDDHTSDKFLERDDERKADNLLEEKVQLEDGSFNFVLSKQVDVFHEEVWRCNVCDVIVSGSLEQHANGRKHHANMSRPRHPISLWGIVPEKMSMGDFKLAPGEPVPPGFEDEVRGVTEIQATLDGYKFGPLIGLEYLIELSVFEDDREPQYVCLLCDKRGDPRTFMAHLVSFNHRMTYLQTHFPTAYRAVSPYNTKQYRRNVQNTVTTLCEHIEKKFGRMTPQTADRETFERKKQDYLDAVMKDSHPSERLGETFEHLVDRDAILAVPKVDALAEIKKASEEQQQKSRQYRKRIGKDGKRDPSPPVVAAPAIKTKSSMKSDRRSLSSISSISSSSLSSPRSRSRSRSRSKNRSVPRFNKNARRYPEPQLRRSRSRSPNRRYYRRSSRSYSRTPPRYKREQYVVQPSYYNRNDNGRLPWQRSDYASRRQGHYTEGRLERRTDNIKNDRYDDFKKQCNALEIDMDKILEQHEKNPEKHSMYPEEWKKFWNRRYKELQAENKDPTKHDFKPEWIDFWNKRMKEMHDAELKGKKEAIRKRLNLPEEPAPICFKIKGKRKQSDSSEHEVKKIEVPSTSESEIIIIDDSKDDDIVESKRSRSPWEMESRETREPRERNIKIDYSREYYKPSRPYREISRERDHGRDYKRMAAQSPKYLPKEVVEEEINIVAILRLLTALEEKLGSLGPRVIEMLSQALALEKAEANSADTLLDNEVNCVFFETVKEKLKGQLLAGMVEKNAEKTFKNAIQKIASLLHFANERKRESDKMLKIKNLEPVKIPGIGAVDKPAIAKQIATALVAQGKTNVTQAELEQLINAVVGMAQASQSSGKPISTAAFIEQLSKPTPITTEIKSIVQPTVTTSKPDIMVNALQLLQSKSTSDTLASFNVQNTMDGLSDSDLKTLLQNFKDLSTDEQHGLITYLKKLEAREPERVERLRKFVKLGPAAVSIESTEKAYTSSGRISPFSIREGGVNPSVEELDKNNKAKSSATTNSTKIHIDSDEDDDYSFEDVFNAASKNVKEKQMQEERNKMLDNPKSNEKSKDVGLNLNDAKMLIANLMGQLGNSSKSSNSGLNLLGLGLNTVASPTSLNPPGLNIANTSNILGNASAALNTASLANLTSSLLSNSKISGINPCQPIKTPMIDSNLLQPFISNQIAPQQNVPNSSISNYGQYNYPANRQYGASFDGNYNQQQMYQTSQAGVTSNIGGNYGNQTAMNTNVEYGGNYANEQRHVQDYNNSSSFTNPGMAPQQRPPAQQPQYNRQGQQYQGYDHRQNYY